MGAPIDIKYLSYSNIPGLIKFLTILGENIPEIRSIEASCVDVHYFHKDLGVSVVELLEKRCYLANKLAPLLTNIQLHAVVRLQQVPKMLDLSDPGKGRSIKQHRKYASSIPWFLREDQTLCL